MRPSFDFLLPKREVLADELPKIWKNKRDEATVKNRHSRIAETIAHLQVAMDLALAHAKDIGAIDENKREYLSKECWQNLLTLGSDHSQLVTTEKPVNQYFQALKTLFIQKRAYLYSKLTYVKGFQDVLDISPVPGDGSSGVD